VAAGFTSRLPRCINEDAVVEIRLITDWMFTVRLDTLAGAPCDNAHT
jgi:hypothetical protein